jgi:hypothetical protein
MALLGQTACMGYVKLEIGLHRADTPLATLTAVRAALAISLPDGYWDSDGDVEVAIAEHSGDCSLATCGHAPGSEGHGRRDEAPAAPGLSGTLEIEVRRAPGA